MTSLPTRLAQALERKRTGMRTNSGHEDAKWSGINEEQARLAPLHRALVECVTALELACQCQVQPMADPSGWGMGKSELLECDGCKALASLDEAIKESGKS